MNRVRLTWPLIGRSEELQVIRDAIAARDRAGVVVCGAAGVGKSRIAREALWVAESMGYQTRWAVGTTSAREVPLGAFAPWARAGVTDTLAAVSGVIDALTASPAPARVLVGVDDAHLLDDLSVFVVHQIVQRSAARVVLTVRDGERIPPGVQELWTGAGFDTMNLQPASRRRARHSRWLSRIGSGGGRQVIEHWATRADAAGQCTLSGTVIGCWRPARRAVRRWRTSVRHRRAVDRARLARSRPRRAPERLGA